MQAVPVPEPVVVAPVVAKPVAAAQVKEIRFRAYSELICFIPVALMGVACWAIGAWIVDAPKVLSYIWMTTMILCIVAVSYDLNIWYMFGIGFLLFIAAPLASLWGIPFVESFMIWAYKDYGVVDPGLMLTFSKWITILFVAEWIIRRFFFYDISSNTLETNAIPNDEALLDLAGVGVRSNYPNGFKQFFLLGTGDMVFSRNEKEFRRIKDIPFLWFFWPKTEKMLQSKSVNVVEQVQ